MRLLKLAFYGLVGYALFEFFRGMFPDVEIAAPQRPLDGGSGQRPGSSEGKQQGQGSAPRQTERQSGEISGVILTGSGQGRTEATVESDGGSRREIVGRGIVK